MDRTKPRGGGFFWLLVVLTVVGLGLGDPVVARWANAAERGQTQAPSDELAELEETMQQVHAVSRAFKLVARLARPSVVHIRVGAAEHSPLSEQEIDEQLRERFKEYYDGELPPGTDPNDIEKEIETYRHWLEQSPAPPGSGSGVIFDADGYILTNNHVVGDRQEITVVLEDEREFEAKVVGTDPKTDLAVLKIDAPNLHPLKMGDSDALEVGDWVIAVGSPFGLQQTVTHGIVSAKGRSRITGVDIEYQDFIQTDAAINPGNSGGPLLNLRGEVVGINTAIATHGDGVNAGIAFTIPSNMALKVASQLKNTGEVRRGYLGIVPVPVDKADYELFGLPETGGIMVESIVRRSPADRAGLRIEDVIVAIDDVPIVGYEQFRTVVADLEPNKRAALRVIRDHEEVTVRVRMGLQPEDLHRPLDVGQSGAEPPESSRESLRLGLKLRTARSEFVRQLYGAGTRGVFVTGFGSDWTELPDIEPGELVVACNDKPVRSVYELNKVLEEIPVARRIVLTILEPTGDQKQVTIAPRGKR